MFNPFSGTDKIFERYAQEDKLRYEAMQNLTLLLLEEAGEREQRTSKDELRYELVDMLLVRVEELEQEIVMLKKNQNTKKWRLDLSRFWG